MRVRGIEAAEDFGSRLIMIADAPEIDTLTDAETPPAWDGRVGAEVAATVLAPATAVFQQIRSGVAGTGTGSGIATTTPGAYTAIVSIVVGAQDPEIPSQIDPDGVQALGSMGRAVLGISISGSNNIDKVQVYRAPFGVALDTATQAVQAPFNVTPNSTTTFVDGDATRNTLISDGSFADGSGWTAGVGWMVPGGKASHMAGTAGTISKPVTTTTGKNYRIGVTISGHTSGTLKLALIGGTNVESAAVSANGVAFATLTAIAATTDVGFIADAAFDGTIDDVVIFQKTPSCAPSGVWDYWIEPQNNLGVAGPVSGPFTATIY